MPGFPGSLKWNQEFISKHTWVLRKVLHCVNRNRNLGTPFMVSCSTDCVWWPNTETSSPRLPLLLRNYTRSSGSRICLCRFWRSCWNETDQATHECAFSFRILVQICKTQAFQKLNPAQFELHDEVSDAIQVSDLPNEIITNSMYIIRLMTCIITFLSDRYTGVVYHQKGVASAND